MLAVKVSAGAAQRQECAQDLIDLRPSGAWNPRRLGRKSRSRADHQPIRTSLRNIPAADTPRSSRAPAQYRAGSGAPSSPGSASPSAPLGIELWRVESAEHDKKARIDLRSGTKPGAAPGSAENCATAPLSSGSEEPR